MNGMQRSSWGEGLTMWSGRHTRLGYGRRGFTAISSVTHPHPAYSGNSGDCTANEFCGEVLVLYRSSLEGGVPIHRD